MAAGVVVRVMAGPAEDVLNMTGHSSFTAWTYLVIVPVSMVLAAALILPFGTAGAALATSAALIGRAIWLAAAARERCEVDTTIFSGLNLFGGSRSPRGRGRELPQAAE
jgi:O-antigen/teichoic acid export membrane protein